MKTTTESNLGRLVLALCHVAGMLDLVILPLWVGGMMATYRFDPQLAGGIVTAYLVGTLVSNAVLSRRFGSLPEKAIAVVGFAVPATAFLAMTLVPELHFLSTATSLIILHFIGGAGAGAGLVIVHGVIGRSANPHRLFAIVNFGVSLWAVLFFATMARFLPSMGVNAVFLICSFMAGLAALGALIAFPSPGATPRPNRHEGSSGHGHRRTVGGARALLHRRCMPPDL